jgi:hypothetical protein
MLAFHVIQIAQVVFQLFNALNVKIQMRYLVAFQVVFVRLDIIWIVAESVICAVHTVQNVTILPVAWFAKIQIHISQPILVPAT